MINVWISAEFKDIALKLTKTVIVKTDKLNKVLPMYFQEAYQYDILIIPYFTGYLRLFSRKNEKGILGPILMINTGPNTISLANELTEKGLLILNRRNFDKIELIKIINFIISFYTQQANAKTIRQNLLPANNQNIKLDDSTVLNFLDRQLENKIDEIGPLSIRDNMIKLFRNFFETGKPILLSLNSLDLENSTDVNIICDITAKPDNKHISLLPVHIKDNIFEKLKMRKTIKLSFDYTDKFYFADFIIKEITEQKHIILEIPGEISEQKRKNLRIKIDAHDPLAVYTKFISSSTQKIEIVDISRNGIAYVEKEDRDMLTPFVINYLIYKKHIIGYGMIKNKAVLGDVYRYGAEIEIDQRDSVPITKYILEKQVKIITRNIK